MRPHQLATSIAASTPAGIRQGDFNQMVNGKRDINREDLRRISKNLLIPADYILGISTELTPPGVTRSVAELARDVATRVEREASSGIEVEQWEQELFADMVGGADLLGALVRLVREEWEALAGTLETRRRIGSAIKSLPKKGADDARRELQRAYASAQPASGRVFLWQAVAFTRGAGQARLNEGP